MVNVCGMVTAFVKTVLLCAFVYSVAFSAEETNDYIHYQLGVKYKNENKYDQAIDEFRKLLTAYPDNYNAYMQVAEIKRAQNLPRLVVYNLKKALTYNPGWAKAQKMLAEAFEADKQYQNSIIEFQHYQQVCDPAELDSIQERINKLVRKVKGEPEPVAIVDSTAKAQPVTVSTTKNQSEIPKKDSSSSVAKSSALAKKQLVVKIPEPVEVPTAEGYFQQAITLYNQGKLNEALPVLKKAVALQRNYAGAFYYAGLIRYKLGQIDLAKTNFAKSFSYPDGASMSHYYLGKIYGMEKNYKDAIAELTEYVQMAGESEQKKEAVTLLEYYKKLIGDKTPLPDAAYATGDSIKKPPVSHTESIAPESSLVTIEMRIDSLLTMVVVDTLTEAGQAMLAGVRAFKAGLYDEAIKEFKKIMASYPAKTVAAQCIHDIGICYMKLRLYPNAENQFDQIIERYPTHVLAAPSLFFKAYSYFERGETARTEKLMRDFIQKYRSHPWRTKAYEKLGDMYVDLHQPGKAIDAYQQAAMLATENTEKQYALYKLAGTYSEVANISKAEETYRKVIDSGEKIHCMIRVPDAYYRIADNLYQAKKYPAAMDMYQKATRKYPTYQETPWGLFQVGNIFKNTREYQKAIDMFKNLAKTFPDDYWAKQAKWKMEDAVWENEYKSVLD